MTCKRSEDLLAFYYSFPIKGILFYFIYIFLSFVLANYSRYRFTPFTESWALFVHFPIFPFFSSISSFLLQFLVDVRGCVHVSVIPHHSPLRRSSYTQKKKDLRRIRYGRGMAYYYFSAFYFITWGPFFFFFTCLLAFWFVLSLYGVDNCTYIFHSFSLFSVYCIWMN